VAKASDRGLVDNDDGIAVVIVTGDDSAKVSQHARSSRLILI